MSVPPGNSLPALRQPSSPAKRSERDTAGSRLFLALGEASRRGDVLLPVHPLAVFSRQEASPHDAKRLRSNTGSAESE